MENSEKDTLLNLQTVLDAIRRLRQEMNERFSSVEQRLMNVETDVSEIKQMQFIFENEFDRLKALSHNAIAISHENRPDARITQKEIEAWSAEVRNLIRQTG